MPHPEKKNQKKGTLDTVGGSIVQKIRKREGVRGSSPGNISPESVPKKTALTAVFFGTLSGARTLDPLIKSQLLYQLS